MKWGERRIKIIDPQDIFFTPRILKHRTISNFASLVYTVVQLAGFAETSPDVVRRVYRHVNPQTLRPMAKDVANMLDITEIPVKRNLGEVQKTAENQGFGEWRSLVAHIVRDDGVGGSNPLSPTIFSREI